MKIKNAHQIIFKKLNCLEIVRIQSNNAYIGDKYTLNEVEEIIGIYGGYGDTKIEGIEILVWTPPKF